MERYGKRRVALEKLREIREIRKLKTQLPKAQDLQIKAVENLTLNLRDSANNKELGECSVYSWKEGEADPILVDVKKNKWRAFADALAHRLRDDGMYTRYANDFEVYLADDDDNSVLDRLRSAGIPEEALDEVNKSGSSSPDGSSVKHEMAEVVPANSRQSKRQKKQIRDNVGVSPPTNANDATTQAKTGGNSVTRRNRDTSKNKDKPVQTSGGEGRINEPRPETGLDAERWLKEQLEKQWPQVEKVYEGRDFIISYDGIEIHIEAKHVETRPGIIHWSRTQYETCKKIRKRTRTTSLRS